MTDREWHVHHAISGTPSLKPSFSFSRPGFNKDWNGILKIFKFVKSR